MVAGVIAESDEVVSGIASFADSGRMAPLVGNDGSDEYHLK
jgi:hypothetical protein